jgi:Leucine-rich repeat (LRR) protein
LDLSYNSISNIEAEAFSQLQLLHYLDLSSNQLVVLPANVFAPLITLETLKLSSNVGFGKIMGRDVVNSTLTSLYLHLSVTPKLKNLDMERCELHQLNLRQGTGLKSINLSFNNITDFSTIQLPDGVESLKLSGNPIRYFVAKSLPHLNELRELILQDLPNLGAVDEYSLYGFPKLNHLTFEGSKNLSTLHAHAFGMNVVDDEIDLSLKILNLRGCHLRTLDSSLETVLDKLDEFHLDGNPFNCDCHIKWIKYLNVETNLRCYKPQAHLNKLLSEVPDKKLKCENMFMKKLLNTMILLFLLIACSLAIWFFLRRLNPSRRNKLQKVSPDSPYSPYHRVTIDPNRAEYSMY